MVESAAKAASIVERCALYPYVCSLLVQHRIEYHDGTSQVSFDRTELFRQVLQAPNGQPPIAEDIVAGLGLTAPLIMRADIVPAGRFDDMQPAQRQRYKAEYRAYLMWRKAHSVGLTEAQLKPWADGPDGYDPVTFDERVERWAKPVGRYAGD